MADIRAGITPTQVDPSTAPSFPVGTEADDPRNGFTGNRIKYCRANGTIAANDAVHADISFATASERHATVISTSAVSQALLGVNDCTGVSISSGQFFWATVRGRAQVKTTGVAAGDRLGTSATAGTLTVITSGTPTAAEVIAAIAAADGAASRAMAATNTPVTGQSFVLLA